MTKFTLSATRADGEPISVTWEDGELSGDPQSVMLIKSLARGYEGISFGTSVLGFTKTDHLSSPATAYLMMETILPKPTKMTGGFLLEGEQPPEGAII